VIQFIFRKSKNFDEISESIDINIPEYLPRTNVFTIFDPALMMKSKTSKVANKPPFEMNWGLLLVSADNGHSQPDTKIS
jgi:hypothetical protein